MNKPYSQLYYLPSKLENSSDANVSNLQIGDTLNVTNGKFTNNSTIYTDNNNLYIQGKGDQSINIGYNLPTSADETNVCVGNNIGLTGFNNNNTVVGFDAGKYNLGSGCVAIGYEASSSNLTVANNRTSVGYRAGFYNQGQNSVAIGALAGECNQHANTIIINATGSALNSAQANSLFVKPIRTVNKGLGFPGSLYYNSSTREITYSAT